MKALLEALQPADKDWSLAQAINPAHIAIITDGNGRWAARRRLPRVAGHKAGIGPVRATVETCARLGGKVLTLYAFSVENWKRPRGEVETLWRLQAVLEYRKRDRRYGGLSSGEERHPVNGAARDETLIEALRSS